jgi:hypothetical protein
LAFCTEGLKPIPPAVAGLSLGVKVENRYTSKNKGRKLGPEAIQSRMRKELIHEYQVKLRHVRAEMEVTPPAESIHAYGIRCAHPALEKPNARPEVRMKVVNEVEPEAWSGEFEGEVIIQVALVVCNPHRRAENQVAFIR